MLRSKFNFCSNTVKNCLFRTLFQMFCNFRVLISADCFTILSFSLAVLFCISLFVIIVQSFWALGESRGSWEIGHVGKI